MNLTVSLVAVFVALTSLGVCQSTPQVRHIESPTYPNLARTAHVEGIVKVRLHLDETGKVTSLDMLSGPPLLREAVETKAKKWIFVPRTGDSLEISFEFHLIGPERRDPETEVSFDLPGKVVVVTHTRPIDYDSQKR